MIRILILNNFRMRILSKNPESLDVSYDWQKEDVSTKGRAIFCVICPFILYIDDVSLGAFLWLRQA